MCDAGNTVLDGACQVAEAALAAAVATAADCPVLATEEVGEQQEPLPVCVHGAVRLRQVSNFAHYALLNYVAGCLKSRHNHHAVAAPQGRWHAVMVDNDRCGLLQHTLDSVPASHSAHHTYFRDVVLTCPVIAALGSTYLSHLAALVATPSSSTSSTTTQESALHERFRQLAAADILMAEVHAAAITSSLAEVAARIHRVLAYARDECGM